MQGKELILSIGETLSDDFILNEHLLENYKQMFYYLSKNKNYCEYLITKNEKCFDKGLFLYGDVGVGKSFFFKFLRRWYYQKEQLLYDRLIIVPFREIEKGYKENGTQIWTDYGGDLFKELVVDEVVKDENITQKHYGNSENIFEELILERYNLFIEKGIKTHFTTNAMPSQINNMFHPRVVDRIREMCNIHFWTGESLRK